MKKEIKKIDSISLAKIYGLSMAILGLVIGVVLGFILFFVSSFVGTDRSFAPFLAPGMGILGFIFMPVLYGILGFFVSGLSGFIYNFLASWVGGIKIELTDIDED